MFGIMEALVALFSLLAAGCWMKSAAVKLPNITENSTLAGTGALAEALKRQAKWNRLAALLAAIAALKVSLNSDLLEAEIAYYRMKIAVLVEQRRPAFDAQVPIKRSIVSRTVIPRRRKKTKISSAPLRQSHFEPSIRFRSGAAPHHRLSVPQWRAGLGFEAKVTLPCFILRVAGGGKIHCAAAAQYMGRGGMCYLESQHVIAASH